MAFDKIYKTHQGNGVYVVLKRENVKISECKISASNGIWSISEWFTSTTYKHQGYGSKVLKEALLSLYDEYGMPEEIRYNWNGVNEYVYLWLEKHFNAKPLVPEFLRYDEDKKTYHIYILDKHKVLEFAREP